MRPKLYLETTIPSYLAARRTRNPLMAGKLAATKRWWRLRRGDFDLFVSQLVVDEVARGDANAARRRAKIISRFPLLPITTEAIELAVKIQAEHFLPPGANDDVLHIATATVNRAHFLLTWNCAHINNAEILPLVRNLCLNSGYSFPVVCTPLELMGTFAT
ncbi:MAG: type II toxin-antitoxin system VapC family toxin [Limisphaerales bacterium]